MIGRCNVLIRQGKIEVEAIVFALIEKNKKFIIFVDRMKTGQGHKTAIQEIEEGFGSKPILL